MAVVCLAIYCLQMGCKCVYEQGSLHFWCPPSPPIHACAPLRPWALPALAASRRCYEEPPPTPDMHRFSHPCHAPVLTPPAALLPPALLPLGLLPPALAPLPTPSWPSLARLRWFLAWQRPAQEVWSGLGSLQGGTVWLIRMDSLAVLLTAGEATSRVG